MSSRPDDADQIALEFYAWAIGQGWGPYRVLSEIGCPASSAQWLTEATILTEIATVWRQLGSSSGGK